MTIIGDKTPLGETFESFLGELGLRDDVYGTAIQRVLAWQAAKDPESNQDRPFNDPGLRAKREE